MKLVVTPIAARDIEATLRRTFELFGQRQVDTYSDYIAHAFEMLAADPYRPSSRARPDIREGARSLRLAVAAGRTHGASHVLYYRVDQTGAHAPTVILMRFLHERMEAKAALIEDAG